MVDNLGLLMGTMERLLDTYRRLLVLSKQQNRTLIAGDVGRLNRVLQEMSGEIEKTNELEAVRMQLAERLAVEYQLEAGPISVSVLGQRIDSKSNRRLQAATVALREILAELQMLNAQNDLLTQQSLSNLSQSFQFLVSSRVETPVYGRTDRRDVGEGPRFISVQS